MATVKKYSKGMVAWHWLTASGLIFLIFTGFMRNTILPPRQVVPEITERIYENPTEEDYKVGKQAFRVVNHRVFEWHAFVGVGVSILLAFRIFLLFMGDRQFISKLKLLFRPGAPKAKGWVNLLYTVFYLCILFMAVTGVIMKYGEGWGFDGHFTHELEEIHGMVAWFFLVYIPVHTAGVFIAENTNEPGVGSTMMNGMQRPGEEE